MPGQWGFDSWAAWRAGTPGILSHPGSWRQISLHIHYLQLLAGGEPEADGSSDNVMVTAWERSHLHFLKAWLPVGEKPEPHASAKWFLHRTPLSCTVPSFNLPLYKQNNENFPSQVLALWLAQVFPHRKQATWSVCSACLLATAQFAESTGHIKSSTQGLCTPGLGYVMLLDVEYGQPSAMGVVSVVSIIN